MNGQFEQQFAKLAENHVTGRLPELNPYYQGFRLIDKADDQTRAVGIAGYKIGKTIAFVPIIFYKGDLLGSDIMIFKQIDIFAPAIPKWLEAVKTQSFDPNDLGKAVKRSGTLSSSGPNDIMMSNHLVLSNKIAEDGIMDWEFGSMEMAKMLADDAKRCAKNPISPFDLSVVLKRMPKEAADTLYETFRSNAPFANATLRFYPFGTLADVAAAIQKTAEAEGSVTSEKAPVSANKVTIIDGMSHPEAVTMDRDAKKLLTRNGVYIKDERDNTSTIFDPKVKLTDSLKNPSSVGVHMALLRDGDFIPVILLNYIDDCCKLCCNSNEDVKNNISDTMGNEVKVITLDGSKSTTAKTTNIWTRELTAAEIEGLRSKPLGADAKMENILQAQAKDDTNIFLADSKGNGVRLWKHDKFEITGPGGVLATLNGTTMIPQDARVLISTEDPDNRDTELRLGDYKTAERSLKQRLDVHDMSVSKANGLYRIESEKGIFPQLTKKEAAEHLATREGISGPQTMELLKRADAQSKVSGLIKYAAGYTYYQPPNDGIENMVSSVPMTQTTETSTISRGDPMQLPMEAIDSAVGAADKGDKDMFDLKVIEGIIRATDVADLRKMWLSDILKGMNSLGRLLLTQYWRRDLYEERYGDDLDELTDKTKQAFNTAGDVALYMKEKMSLSPDSSEHQLDTLSRNLGDIDQAE